MKKAMCILLISVLVFGMSACTPTDDAENDDSYDTGISAVSPSNQEQNEPLEPGIEGDAENNDQDETLEPEIEDDVDNPES